MVANRVIRYVNDGEGVGGKSQHKYVDPILHVLFQVGSTRGCGGGGGHKVPAAFFSKTVKASAIKLVSTLTN